MNMFFGLTNSEPDDTGLESYEDVVENYFGALENLEDEIAGLEQLSDSMDNAEAFKRVIESGKATEALYDFGFEASEDFGELVGFSSLSSITMESMDSVGTFASESIKSKLRLGWEKVKDFIIRLWEKLKEFGRWIVGLFNRKRQRLEAIKKAAVARTAKAEANPDFKDIIAKKEQRFSGKSAAIIAKTDFDAKVEALKKITNDTTGVDDVARSTASKSVSNDTTGVDDVARSTASKSARSTASKSVSDDKTTVTVTYSNESYLVKLGYKTDSAGRIVESGLNKRSAGSLAEWGKYDVIAKECTAVIELFDKKDVFVKYAKGLEICSKKASDAERETAAWDRDINNEKADKADREEASSKDYDRIREIRSVRARAIWISRLSVIVGKEINNLAACIIAVANIMGL